MKKLITKRILIRAVNKIIKGVSMKIMTQANI